MSLVKKKKKRQKNEKQTNHNSGKGRDYCLGLFVDL